MTGSSRKGASAPKSGGGSTPRGTTGGGTARGAKDGRLPAPAQLGGATADGDGLTAAMMTAASLGGDSPAEASEPVIVIEQLTVLSETPIDPATADAASGDVGAQQRWLMIAELAYLRAARRRFAPGGELDDWLQAEQEVDARLGGG